MFCDRPDGPLRWWDIWTRPGFRHCFVARWCDWSQRWLLVDWRAREVTLEILFDFQMEQVLRGISKFRATVVEFEAPEGFDKTGELVTYCSNLIGRLLGLGSKWVLTPQGLYRNVLRAGGKIVYDWRDDEQTQAIEATEAARETSSRA